eukprot:3655498-Amphidinium_carterae.2
MLIVAVIADPFGEAVALAREADPDTVLLWIRVIAVVLHAVRVSHQPQQMGKAPNLVETKATLHFREFLLVRGWFPFGSLLVAAGSLRTKAERLVSEHSIEDTLRWDSLWIEHVGTTW